ncbi:MAG: hypothetical protein Crog4KO_17490 [Crocinitomicaceae bacterium]
MKLILIPLLFLFLTFNLSAQTVEDEVLEELQISFKEEGLNLKGLIEEYEALLIEGKLLKDGSMKSWKTLLYNMCNRGVIAHVASYDMEIVELEFQLSLQHFSTAVTKVKKADELRFMKSDLHPFIERYPQSKFNGDPTLTYLYQTFEGASKDLEKHDLYKHLIVLTIANFADVLDNSGDKILRSESDYARWIRSVGGNIPMFQSRNTCWIRVDRANEIQVRGVSVDSAEMIKPTISDFMNYNRSLSVEETAEKVKDKSYAGYNLPFFSQINDAQINEKIEAINRQLDTVSDNRMLKGLIWTREQWIRKKHFLHTNGDTNLKEIDRDAHLELISSTNDPQQINELLVPVLEVLAELRNKECLAVFGESFAEVSKRNNFLLNDHYKLRYLENQFPLFILVNPSTYLYPDGPPPEAPEPPIRVDGKN